jgi:hypothetical protein
MTMTDEDAAANDQGVMVPLITGNDAIHDWACQDHNEVQSLPSHQSGWLAACRFYGFIKP